MEGRAGPHAQGSGWPWWQRPPPRPGAIGFNPRWEETLSFQLQAPELALVRFVVEDYDSTSCNDFVGQFTLPLASMREGGWVPTPLPPRGRGRSPATHSAPVSVPRVSSHPSALQGRGVPVPRHALRAHSMQEPVRSLRSQWEGRRVPVQGTTCSSMGWAPSCARDTLLPVQGQPGDTAHPAAGTAGLIGGPKEVGDPLHVP